jgi:hypothetical protein
MIFYFLAQHPRELAAVGLPLADAFNLQKNTSWILADISSKISFQTGWRNFQHWFIKIFKIIVFYTSVLSLAL